MKLLLLSIGRRSYLVDYFKEIDKDVEVFAGDANPLAPGLYSADHQVIFPKFTSKQYLPFLIKYCKKHKIDGILSINDKELPILAHHKNEIEKSGTKLLISSAEAIQLAFDKYLTYQACQELFIPTPQTFISLDNALEALDNALISFPLLLKPRFGSGSVGISRVKNKTDLIAEFKRNSDMMIQTLIQGSDFTVDAFCNSDSEVTSLYMKKKLEMREGGAITAVSFWDQQLAVITQKIVKNKGFLGTIDLDFMSDNQRYYLLEINPRFGGSYPLSHSLGAAFPHKYLQLIKGNNISKSIVPHDTDIYMMKYDGILIQKITDPV